MSAPRALVPAAELVARIARGDEGAFGQLYDAYAPLAFGLIRRILREKESAEEVLQEVFWQVWREAGAFDPARGSAEAWLLMRAKTRAIDKLRSVRRKEQTFVAPVDEAIARPAEPRRDEDPALAAEDRTLVGGALDRLPAAQRRVIELAFYEGLTQAEIATRLGEPLGTVKTRARLGLERLRALVSGKEDPGT
jgi:RNA polymerase sigma-70 factor (ECF subfamily)